MQKGRLIIAIYMAIASITVLAISRCNEQKRLKAFHQSTIEGIVTYKHSSSGGDKVKIGNEVANTRYIFVHFNKNIDRFFSSFVEIGDSIYKSPNAEYLLLFRENKEYKFRTKSSS